MSRVLLIDADVRSSRRGQPFPNLALLKLGTHYLREGDEVRYVARPGPAEIPLIDFDPDLVFVSSVFLFNSERAKKIRDTYRKLHKTVMTGGLAFGRPYQKLPAAIEHLRPDYDFFELDYSLGFSSRGCTRKCPFCYVWRMEGKIRDHAPIDEFLDDRHKRLLLLDGNFVESPKFRESAELLIERGIRTNLNQGIDLRALDEESAVLLKELRSTNRSFANRRYYAAWDRMRDEKETLRGLELLLDAGVTASSIYVYVLIAYETSLEQNLYRFEKLREYGVEPFVMLYENEGNEEERAFSRYVNRRFYRSFPWREYDRRPPDRDRVGGLSAESIQREIDV